jgi:hypothetical protein
VLQINLISNFSWLVDECMNFGSKVQLLAYIPLIHECEITTKYLCYNKASRKHEGEDICDTLTSYFEHLVLS